MLSMCQDLVSLAPWSDAVLKAQGIESRWIMYLRYRTRVYTTCSVPYPTC